MPDGYEHTDSLPADGKPYVWRDGAWQPACGGELGWRRRSQYVRDRVVVDPVGVTMDVHLGAHPPDGWHMIDNLDCDDARELAKRLILKLREEPQ